MLEVVLNSFSDLFNRVDPRILGAEYSFVERCHFCVDLLQFFRFESFILSCEPESLHFLPLEDEIELARFTVLHREIAVDVYGAAIGHCFEDISCDGTTDCVEGNSSLEFGCENTEFLFEVRVFGHEDVLATFLVSQLISELLSSHHVDNWNAVVIE